MSALIPTNPNFAPNPATYSAVCFSFTDGFARNATKLSLCVFNLAIESSKPPAHSVCETPPGVPSNAGVVPASHPLTNHSGLSRESIKYVSNSNPDSLIISPRRMQNGQNGMIGPIALSPSSTSPLP
jgi:hypothetical protein|tara:strand:+ start:1174 stop:1554 length:381 start_codon:yes stop_codon:yes gene_type:complete